MELEKKDKEKLHNTKVLINSEKYKKKIFWKRGYLIYEVEKFPENFCLNNHTPYLDTGTGGYIRGVTGGPGKGRGGIGLFGRFNPSTIQPNIIRKIILICVYHIFLIGLYNGQPNYGWDIDHKTPISIGKTIEDIIALNHYTNLQPLCSYVNRNIKKDKLKF